MNIFGDEGLKRDIKCLKEDKAYLKRSLNSAQEKIADNDIENARKDTNNRLTVAGKDNEIHELKVTLNSKVEKEVAQTKKDYKIKTENLEREHSNKMKSLEKEYVEKLARVDRKLEEDKSSFRKYLKTEFNSKVENLEKDNERLMKVNFELLGKNSGLERTSGVLEGKLDKVIDAFNDVVKALPTVTASITTPEVTVNVPGAQGQKGGNQEKKN